MPNILVKTAYVAPKQSDVTLQSVGAPSPAGGVAAEGQADAAIAFVKNWAAAWAAKDVEGYLASYARDFKPAELSRADWEVIRKKRIRQPDFIRVDIVDPQVSLENNRFQIGFIQKYASSQFSDSTRKTLLLVNEDGKLRILEERVEVSKAIR